MLSQRLLQSISEAMLSTDSNTKMRVKCLRGEGKCLACGKTVLYEVTVFADGNLHILRFHRFFLFLCVYDKDLEGTAELR